MNTNLTCKLLMITVLIIVTILGDPSSHQAAAQGGVNLRLPFNGTRRLTAYIDHRSPTYGSDTYSNIVVYNGEDRIPCADCGQVWTTQGPYCYNGHNGTDYSLNREPVLAAASGKVTFRDWRSDDYGNSIRIDHGNGYQTWYSHLENFSVPLNSQVIAGQQIGVSGNTGVNQPYHLHFEVRRNGNVTDPFGWRGSGQDPLAGGAVCLWGDGQCTAIVVEDESEWFYKYGTGWDWDCHGNGWTMRLVANKKTSESAYARWHPDLPYAGPYAVFAFIPAVHATTTNARYTIHDKDGDHIIPISQLDYSDEWIYWGSYDFWDGTFGYVYLNNATDESDGSTEVSFDSIKFRQFRVYLPVVAP
jgi:hypothetical protein